MPKHAPVILCAVVAALLAPGPGPGARAEPTPDPWAACAAQAARAEQAHRLPHGLLQAIAKVESGRRPNAHGRAKGEVLAWPWTVMAEGRGRYLPSKAAAIAEVEALRARGIRNIDVGCFQINLYYHPNAFDSLAAAFDPASNAQAAARFLVELKTTWGSWTRAVGNYHSNTPTLSGPYRVKVYKTLYRERRKAAKAERQRVSG